jgi:hypothetical protein
MVITLQLRPNRLMPGLAPGIFYREDRETAGGLSVA